MRRQTCTLTAKSGHRPNFDNLVDPAGSGLGVAEYLPQLLLQELDPLEPEGTEMLR